jgi:hypothetical protein
VIMYGIWAYSRWEISSSKSLSILLSSLVPSSFDRLVLSKQFFTLLYSTLLHSILLYSTRSCAALLFPVQLYSTLLADTLVFSLNHPGQLLALPLESTPLVLTLSGPHIDKLHSQHRCLHIRLVSES